MARTEVLQRFEMQFGSAACGALHSACERERESTPHVPITPSTCAISACRSRGVSRPELMDEAFMRGEGRISGMK